MAPFLSHPDQRMNIDCVRSNVNAKVLAFWRFGVLAFGWAVFAYFQTSRHIKFLSDLISYFFE